MRQHNYCYDTCDHNRIPRRFWDETDALNSIKNGTSVCPRLKKILL